MITAHSRLSITEQCELLGVSRSAVYYQSMDESPLNQFLMQEIDKYHTDHPTWGSRMLRDRLRLDGYAVNRKRIQRLMTIMDIKTIYPNTSKS